VVTEVTLLLQDGTVREGGLIGRQLRHLIALVAPANDEPVTPAPSQRVANAEPQASAACSRATFTFFARFVELNKLSQRNRLAWNWIPIHSHGSDDWYMRTSLGPKRLPAELAA